MQLTYTQALDFLLGQLPMFQRIGPAAYRADLNNIIRLCDALDNPQTHLRCIHVAGTNGKGSVTHIIAAILQANGFKVGVFSSPHYKDYRERIKINGALISEDYVTDFVSKNLDLLKSIQASFFEVTTAMAFEYFKDRNADFAVIETGMGGRLDSTNIINPILSVITNISYDHQQFLGNTLEKIAGEKAGIIKPKVPVLIGERQTEIQGVFMSKASGVQAPIYFSDELFDVKFFEQRQGITNFSILKFSESIILEYNTDLTGSYQEKNICTALSAIEVLARVGVLKVAKDSITEGLKNIKETTRLIGRWMIIGEKPTIIFDSAHNEGGIAEVMKQLHAMTYRKVHIVYGTVNDKSLDRIFDLLDKNATYYFCKPDIPRGKEAEELQNEAKEKGLRGQSFNSVSLAYQSAISEADQNDIVLVVGSIFVVAELM